MWQPSCRTCEGELLYRWNFLVATPAKYKRELPSRVDFHMHAVMIMWADCAKSKCTITHLHT